MKLNLQNKLLLPILTTLLVFMGICAVLLARIMVDQNERHTLDMLYAGNAILVKNINNVVRNYTNTVRVISNMPPMRQAAELLSREVPSDDAGRAQALAQVQELLEVLPMSYPTFLQINFAGPDGSIIASSNPKTVGRINISGLDYFRTAMLGKENISAPLMSMSVGEKTVMVAAPVVDETGKSCGVLYAILPCKWLVADTISGVKMAKSGYAYIVDGASGLMLAHNVFDKVQRMDMFVFQPWMRELKDDEGGVRADYRDSAGNRRLAVYYKEPLSGWIAVSCIAKEEIEAQAENIRNIIVAMMLGCALIVAVVFVLVVQPVTADVHRTNRYAQAVTAGDLEAALDMRRNDELGDLGQALRQMVSSLKRMVRLSMEQSQERQRNLASMRDAMMLSLADLVESRDANTGHHIRKTAAYTRIIMEELQRSGAFGVISDAYIDQVVRSAPMHDIGKIKVPDAILNKPGKLTDEEFAIMKTHAAAGGEIIGHILEIVPDADYLSVARDIAAYHHERWDGRGYPDGLAGEAIPLAARVMAVADVFDALVSARPYKKAFSLEEALDIIRKESGSHFDPKVAEAFFAAREAIIRVEGEFRGEAA